ICAFLYLLIDSGPFLNEVLSRGQTIGRDFAVFWTASVLLWRGDALALFDPATYQPALEQVMGVDLAFMPFPYPPHSLLFVVALSLFPYLVALVLWLTGRFQFMVPTYFMSGRLLGLALWQCWTLQAISAAMAAMASIWVFRQAVPHQLKAAVAMVAAFLVSPYLLTYDMTIVMVAILLAGQCFAPKWWESIVCALAWLLPAVVLPADMPIGPIILTALFLVLLQRVREARHLDLSMDLRPPVPHQFSRLTK
ncbi:MAG: hypothetical protein J0626_03795, partial [Rhodospirillaceae bacterium]|nr:hypothetical protein [Rhodospirillaceae bacterium]